MHTASQVYQAQPTPYTIIYFSCHLKIARIFVIYQFEAK